MFTEPTVFILGAGASWHYGYPTGQQLIKKVRESAKDLIEYKRKAPLHVVLEYETNRDINNTRSSVERRMMLAESHTRTIQESETLIEKLEANNPLVIDHFLNLNPKLRELGKLLIADALRSSFIKHNEKKYFDFGRKANDEYDHHDSDDWVRFVVHELTSSYTNDPSEIFTGNNVVFITFNYDRSLERRIIEALSANEVVGDKNMITNFVNERVIHVYGELNDVSIPNCYDEYVTRWNEAFQASRDLCVIGNVDKNKYRDRHEIAKNCIFGARNIFILGFGFDETNCGLIGLNSVIGRGDKHIYLTNFGDSGKINADLGRLFSSISFENSCPAVAYGGNVTCYKSVKGVYDALNQDFALKGRQRQ